jgi:hypothetical protein
MRRLEIGVQRDLLREDVAHTPAAAVATPLADLALPAAPLSWLQRLNLDFVVVVNQLLQSFFVALLVMAFLVAFGLIVVPASVQFQWIGGPATVLLEFELLDEVRVLSAELLSVSALLSGIVGLYFTGLALTDAAYKAEHFTTVLSEVRQLLSVRAVYLAVVASESRIQPED